MLPFTRLTLKAGRTKPPQTLGEHIRAVRNKRGLTQTEAAPLLGVIPATLLHWEKGQTTAPITAMPGIVRFLGYDPSPIPDAPSLGGRMAAYRRTHGLSIKLAPAHRGRYYCRQKRAGHATPLEEEIDCNRLRVLRQLPCRGLSVVRRHAVALGNRRGGGRRADHFPHATFWAGFACAGAGSNRRAHNAVSGFAAELHAVVMIHLYDPVSGSICTISIGNNGEWQSGRATASAPNGEGSLSPGARREGRCV
jgi:DNA-binding XRE family transcriptional regulator